MASDGRFPASVRRWPDLFLVGASHAGTALLRETLAMHPDLWFAEPAEPHYFSGIRPSRHFARQMPVISDEAAYAALFASMPSDAIAAEASTSYLWSPVAPARIAEANPQARVVIMLRDPIDRAWAHHRADLKGGVERRGFLRAIRDELARPGRWGHDQVYLGAGYYADALERYRAVIAPDRLWVGFHETLQADARGTAREVVDWLGRDPDRLPQRSRPRASSGPERRSWLQALRGGSSLSGPDEPAMDDSIRRLLVEVYAADVRRVSELLGVIPPWNNAPTL